MLRIYSIILLTIIWLGFSNYFTWLNLFVGLLLSLIVSYRFLSYKSDSNYTVRLLPLIDLIIYVIKELIISSIILARTILSRRRQTYSHFLKIDVKKTSHLTKMILASIISLTPGTIFIETMEQESALMIHSMLSEDQEQVISFIKDKLEPKISGVFDK